MKYLQDYRENPLIKQYLEKIRKTVSQPWSIMEICGGQTHSLLKNGIIDQLPQDLTMIHGPGCPVCVTPEKMIDKAISLCLDHDVVICSFGDMIRVPGSTMSLMEAKALGAAVKVVYSPMEAVKLASQDPSKEFVFFAVGFETTAPANALSVLKAAESQLKNYSILTSHVLVPPAINALMMDPETSIDGFLAAGHVCTIMGWEEYIDLSDRFSMPIVITGFEPVDLLKGIYTTVSLLESGRNEVKNAYERAVQKEGNLNARDVITRVFQVNDAEWRGIGLIPKSGLEVREEYSFYDADHRFNIQLTSKEIKNNCIAGKILRGIKKPFECPEFGKKCTPNSPLGAPMVSSEGACAAYFHYVNQQIYEKP